jgi:DNA-binding PadR family transcriptional regulator
MTDKLLTPLGYALLGLIHDDARTGYALRKVFETTPMGNYSSSPGSIYPALASLERQGLVETRGEGRGKGLFHLTAAGAEAFEAWLREPVCGKDLSTAMLRFAFLNNHPDRSLTFAFLDSFEAAASGEAQGLATFLDSDFGRAMPLQSRLAVEQGRRQLESSAQWAVWAKGILRQEGEKT